MEAELKYPIKVLYVEDNPMDIDLTRQVFDKLKDKFLFTYIMTGKEAIELLQNEKFDLILLDNHLPDTEGVDLIPRILQIKVSAPILLVTGLGDEELVLKAIKLGASDYIVKDSTYLEKLPETLERAYIISKTMKPVRFKAKVEPIKVLYIEHNEQDIELVENYLFKNFKNIRIKSIRSSLEALSLLEEEKFDVILMDLRMPDIDALELIRRLKHKNIDAPIIIITGKGDEYSTIEAMKLGVYDYVSKDINYIEKLPRIIETNYLRYIYDKSILNHEKKYLDLNITLEQQYQEKTLSLITEIERRKESEKKYYDLYNNFLSFLQSLSEIVIVKDKNLKVTFGNKAFEKFFDLKLESIEREKLTVSYKLFQSQNLIFDNEVKTKKSELRSIVKLITTDGRTRYFEVIKKPLFDIENNFDGIISVYRDLTERIMLERELKLSEERYRSFISNSTELIYSFELEAPIPIHLSEEEPINILYKSAKLRECNYAFAKSYGFTSSIEIINYPIGQFFPLISENVRKALKNFINGNYVLKSFETQSVTKEGEVRYFLESLVGTIENQKLTRIWGVKRDVTELKKLNLLLEEKVKERTRELEMAIQDRESFNYSVVHDLKAPLRAIIGFSEMIIEDYKDKLNEEVKSLINDIIQNGKHLQNLIDDLPRLSRVSLQSLKQETFSLKNLIQQILNELNESKPIENTKIIVNELPEIYGDKALLKVAFINLISNAIKFTRKTKNPEIEIGFFEEDENYVIFIRDNGAGFDERYSEKLFQPFQRLHQPDEFPGTGIGLAIVKKIVDKHKGKIWAKSKINEGTTFFVALKK